MSNSPKRAPSGLHEHHIVQSHLQSGCKQLRNHHASCSMNPCQGREGLLKHPLRGASVPSQRQPSFGRLGQRQSVTLVARRSRRSADRRLRASRKERERRSSSLRLSSSLRSFAQCLGWSGKHRMPNRNPHHFQRLDYRGCRGSAQARLGKADLLHCSGLLRRCCTSLRSKG